MKLIDGDALMEALGIAVECKDCEYYEETDSKIGTCLLTSCGAYPNGYCAWAEVKR